MTVTLRPANLEGDPEQVANLINLVDPKPVTAADVRGWFTHLPEGRISRRRVANAGGQVVGYGAVVHEAYFPPGEFYVWTAVHPGWRNQGTGSALYADALDFLREQGASQLRSEVREDCPEGWHFAEKRGFAVNRHLYESVLDLAGFDEQPFLPLLERLEAEGLRFFSMADQPDEEETRRKLYDLNRSVGLDIPGAEEFPGYEEFEGLLFSAHWYRPEGQLLAAVGGQWVGMASVQLLPEMRSSYNLITGVRRDFRGQGIAQALKVRAIRYARQNGALTMRTNNDADNLAMIAVNQKLGYRPEPGKYLLTAKRK